MMPRPDLASLGVAYRRIPVLAIGRDVYLDSRQQFSRLEELNVPAPKLRGTTGEQQALEKLFSIYITDAGVFRWLAQLLISSDLPLAKDPVFQQDRLDYAGVRFDEGDVQADRAESYREFAELFRLLETTLLADGRQWIAKTAAPSLVDIEAVWPLFFAMGMEGLLPADKFSASIYPKTYAWIERFKATAETAEKELGDPKTIPGDEAVKAITGAEYHDAEAKVDETDFDVVTLGLKKGDVVSVGPTDFGSSTRDKGKLLSIDSAEVVIEGKSESGEAIRIHAPRHGFRIRKE
jgi:glutathione S-transferase